MNHWRIQEAGLRFSELVKRVEKEGDQVITRHGELIAVLISKERYDELTGSGSSLLDFFKNAPLPGVDLDVERSRDLPR